MAKNYTANRPNKTKLMILFVSILVSINVYFAAYLYFARDLTPWQENQPVELGAEKGLTKAKVSFDSFSIAGLAFCFTAIGLMALAKKKKAKG